MLRRGLLAAIFTACLAFDAFGAAVYVRVPPPPIVVERRGPPPGRHYVWARGYHSWDGRAYAWVPGHWALRPRPRAVWVPAHWVHHHHRGWVLAEGHWR